MLIRSDNAYNIFKLDVYVHIMYAYFYDGMMMCIKLLILV